jgi:hypothetical protein
MRAPGPVIINHRYDPSEQGAMSNYLIFTLVMLGLAFLFVLGLGHE